MNIVVTVFFNLALAYIVTTAFLFICERILTYTHRIKEDEDIKTTEKR